MKLRFNVKEDVEEDCLIVKDNEYLISNSFGSNMLIIGNIEDALPLINRLQFLECYCQAMRDHLEYYEWTDKDFRELEEYVKLTIE